MSSWMNDAAVQNHNGNGFSHLVDTNAPPGTMPSMIDPSAFMANSASGQFNQASPGQFNPQMMGMQQPQHRTASPSPFNPMYQTNQVIPSKRPRPREDSIAASPSLNTGMLPTSRAETPVQYGQHPSQQTSQQPQPQHLPHNGSNNATPSPIMANQIRAGSAVPQRVATTSPHPFSPASQNYAPQASPAPSDGQNPYGQGPAGAFQSQGYNPAFAGTPPAVGRPSPNPQQAGGQMMSQHMGQIPGQMGQMGGPLNAMGQMNSVLQPGQVPPGAMFTPQMQQQLAQARTPMEQQKLMYQMQIQRQLQQHQQQQQQSGIPAGSQASAQQRNMMARQQQQQQQPALQQQSPVPQGAPNGQVPPGTPKISQGHIGGPQTTAQRSNATPDQFLNQLSVFMNRLNMPLESNPVIGDRPVHLLHLFQTVQKFNGHRNVTQSNGWTQVAAALGYQPQQLSVAAQQFRGVYERNLSKFEEYVAQQTRAKQQQQGQQPHQQSLVPQQPHEAPQHPHQQPSHHHQQNSVHEQGGPVNHPPGTPKSEVHLTTPQQRMPSSQQQHLMGINHATPNGQQPMPQPPVGANGYSTPQAPVSGPRPRVAAKSKATRGAQAQAQAQASYTGQMMQGPGRPTYNVPGHPDFAPSPAEAKLNTTTSTHGGPYLDGQMGTPESKFATSQPSVPPMDESDEYKPKFREYSTYGGVDIYAPSKVVTDIIRMRPDVPAAQELGNVDIHALTMSVQSGIHSEVRLALDTLATVTISNVPTLDINLHYCDDLLDSIIEYAERLCDLLADNSAEVSDDILIPPYEDTARACQLERLSLRDEPEVGSQDEELNRAVEYLLCITTILRNLSFNPHNQVCIADETVVKFLAQLIRHVGTRNMFLRTQFNMLDIMKDIIVLLSNISGSIELPEREDAFCLLQFLLAFAPAPMPSLEADRLFFPTYQPLLHPYLPPAVDSLAKLLARDEPNRTHFRGIFTAPGSANLLTQAFALAISPVPEHVRDGRPRNMPPTVEIRKPMLMQGLLAADILAGLAPGSESGIARAWLMADNMFQHNLHRTVRDLCRQFESVEIMFRQQAPFQGRGRPPPPPPKDQELLYIVMLAISMLRKLGEKAVDLNDPMMSKLPPAVLPSEHDLLESLGMISMEWRDGFLRNLVSLEKLDW